MAVQVACDYLDQVLASWDFQKPLILGISGPQGSGKLYLADHLLDHLNSKYPHLQGVGLLIDDFYLTNAEQKRVTQTAIENENQILQGRGLPGTHDLSLAISVLDQLRHRKAPVHVPVYDKSAYGGEGDRLPTSEWQQVKNPADVVIFEGWFNGYKSIDELVFPAAYLTQDPSGIVQRHLLHHLEETNRQLRAYEQLWSCFDHFVYLKTTSLQNVYHWRLEQEHALIAKRGTGMTPQQVQAFVDRYMPMYYLYYDRMCDGGICAKGRNLEIAIDPHRAVIAATIK